MPTSSASIEPHGMNGWICTSSKALPMLSFWQLSGCGSTTTNDRTRLLEEFHLPDCGRQLNLYSNERLKMGGLQWRNTSVIMQMNQARAPAAAVAAVRCSTWSRESTEPM